LTAFEVLFGKKPAVHHLKVFGCIVYVCDTKPRLKKLDDCGRKMIFVGYERGTKGYRAYDLIMGKVYVTRDVVFDEKAEWDSGTGNNIETVDVSEEFIVHWEVKPEAIEVEDEGPAEPLTPLGDHGEHL
jgi:hypothetical protein